MNPISNFVFDGQSGQPHAVRIISRDGEPWFVATDLAAVLGYRNAPDMVRMLDSDESDTHNLRIRSENGIEQDREVSIISEPGLYACILKSRRPEAKAFKKWVTTQVLPSIRKTGGYVNPGAELPHGHSGQLFLSHGADIMVAADRTFRSLVRSGRAAGMKTGQAISRANNITKDRTGIDILEALDFDPEDAPTDGSGSPSGSAASDVARFWADVAAGFQGLAGLAPMMSSQAYALYRGWAKAQGLLPLYMARFVEHTRRSGVAYTRRLRWRSDMGEVHQSSFLVPQGVTEFDPAAAVSAVEAVLPVEEGV